MLKEGEEICELIKAYARQRKWSCNLIFPGLMSCVPGWSITLASKPSAEAMQNLGVTDKAIRNASPQQEWIPK